MRIILAGRAGSGKSTIGDYLASVYGFRTYSFADKIKEIALKLFPESFKNERKPRQLLQELGDSLRGLTIKLNRNCDRKYFIIALIIPIS